MRSMADMMSRPEVVDQMIEAHPQFRAMAPQIRQTMQSPMFRAILSDPNALRAVSPQGFRVTKSLIVSPDDADARTDAPRWRRP